MRTPEHPSKYCYLWVIDRHINSREYQLLYLRELPTCFDRLFALKYEQFKPDLNVDLIGFDVNG